MKKRAALLLVMSVWGQAMLAGRAGGLEVFRIGGEAEPRPEGAGINFRQMSWSQFEEKAGLDEEAFSRGMLRPFFLRPEENIALTSVERGGGAHIQPGVYATYAVTADSKNMTDGDPGTFYEWVAGAHLGVSNFLIPVDLGGLFYINRVRLITFQSGYYPDKLNIATNPVGVEDITKQLRFSGGKVGQGQGSWDQITNFLAGSETVFRLAENVQDTIDVRFSTSLARTVDLLLYRLSAKEVKVAEVEVYGEGYITNAFYVGPFIDLEEPGIWGNLRWRGRSDPQAKVWIQSRTGKDLDPNIYWRFTGRGDEISRFDESGKPLDRLAYRKLSPEEVAEITYDTENWSFWSAPYDFADSSGTSLASPGPSSVLQLRADFLSAAGDGGEVEFIEFSATRPPLAGEVVGEIYPPEVPLGETVPLTYAIRPTLRAEHSGFDQLEISAPFGFTGIDSVKIDGAPVEFSANIERPDSTFFSLRLPRHLGVDDSGGLIEVIFRAPVLRYGTAFDGWVRDTERPLDLAQRINPGDAAGELPSETLSVRTSFSDRLLANLRVDPQVFTPNGDGVNDEVKFSFDLLQLTSDTPLRLEVFDLSGHLMREVHEGLQQSGRFSFSWDGRDEAGERVTPGLYLYRISVDAGKGEARETGTLAVVY